MTETNLLAVPIAVGLGVQGAIHEAGARGMNSWCDVIVAGLIQAVLAYVVARLWTPWMWRRVQKQFLIRLGVPGHTGTDYHAVIEVQSQGLGAMEACISYTQSLSNAGYRITEETGSCVAASRPWPLHMGENILRMCVHTEEHRCTITVDAFALPAGRLFDGGQSVITGMHAETVLSRQAQFDH